MPVLGRSISAPAVFELIEFGLYSEAMRRCEGNATQAASLLGVPRASFVRHLDRLSIDRSSEVGRPPKRATEQDEKADKR